MSASPFPHVYAENVFPRDFYEEMRRQLPPASAYVRLSDTSRTTGDYEQRLILHFKELDRLAESQRRFWEELSSWFLASDLASVLVRKFHDVLRDAIGKDLRALEYGVEAMLVKDLDRYRIGPHTDVRSRAVSVMFYLPKDERYERHGTALYEPLQPSFRSDGSAHLEFGSFRKIATAPYRPNAMFGFPRTDASFHGVEPIADTTIERDVLLYILRWQDR